MEKCDRCQYTSKALRVALTSKNIKVGFRNTGIWPFDRGAAKDTMAPSAGFEQEDDKGGEGGTNPHLHPGTHARDPVGIAQGGGDLATITQGSGDLGQVA